MVMAALACCPAARGSQWDPHTPSLDAGYKQWFEGWYLRLTTTSPSAGGGCAGAQSPPPPSLAVVLGYHPHAGPARNATRVMLLVQPAAHAASDLLPLGVQTWRTEQLGVQVAGGPVLRDPDFASPPNFTITSADGGLALAVDGDSCSLALQLPGAALEIECVGGGTPWGPRGESPEGEEGWGGGRAAAGCWLLPLSMQQLITPRSLNAGSAVRLPGALLGSHWFVHSLATPVRYTLRVPGAPAVTATAMAHFEKNWGERFPYAWVWAQGLGLALTPRPDSSSNGSSSSNNNSGAQVQSSLPLPPGVGAVFTLAGGRLAIPVLPAALTPQTWLLGVRKPTRRGMMAAGRRCMA